MTKVKKEKKKKTFRWENYSFEANTWRKKKKKKRQARMSKKASFVNYNRDF